MLGAGMSYRKLLDQLVDLLVEERIADRIAELEPQPGVQPQAGSEPEPPGSEGPKAAAMRAFIAAQLSDGGWHPASLFHQKGQELGLSASYASKVAVDLGVEKRDRQWRLPRPEPSTNGHDGDWQTRARLRAAESLEVATRMD